MPPTSALVEYRDIATVSFGAMHRLAVALTPRWPAQAGRPRRGRAIADLQRSMVGVDRTGASFDAAAGLLHERLIAPLLSHPGTRRRSTSP